MRRGASAAAAPLVAALIACGAGGGAPSELALGLGPKALLDNASAVALSFYAEPLGCTLLRATSPRPRPTLGPFMIALDATSRESGLLYSLDQVPVGTYVVLADALSAGGGIVATGCAEGQRVYDQERSTVLVTLGANP